MCSPYGCFSVTIAGLFILGFPLYRTSFLDNKFTLSFYYSYSYPYVQAVIKPDFNLVGRRISFDSVTHIKIPGVPVLVLLTALCTSKGDISAGAICCL